MNSTTLVDHDLLGGQKDAAGFFKYNIIFLKRKLNVKNSFFVFHFSHRIGRTLASCMACSHFFVHFICCIFINISC